MKKKLIKNLPPNRSTFKPLISIYNSSGELVYNISGSVASWWFILLIVIEPAQLKLVSPENGLAPEVRWNSSQHNKFDLRPFLETDCFRDYTQKPIVKWQVVIESDINLIAADLWDGEKKILLLKWWLSLIASIVWKKWATGERENNSPSDLNIFLPTKEWQEVFMR